MSPGLWPVLVLPGKPVCRPPISNFLHAKPGRLSRLRKPGLLLCSLRPCNLESPLSNHQSPIAPRLTPQALPFRMIRKSRSKNCRSQAKRCPELRPLLRDGHEAAGLQEPSQAMISPVVYILPEPEAVGSHDPIGLGADVQFARVQVFL